MNLTIKQPRDTVFPADALTARTDISGNVTNQNLITVPNGKTYTILYESMNTGSHTNGASMTIDCVPMKLLQVNDFATIPQIERFKHSLCTGDVTVSVSGTTGSPVTTVQVIYVPYDLSVTDMTATVSFPEPLTGSGSYTPMVGMLTSGDMLIVLALGVLILFNVFAVFRRYT